jgi:hypothetical protein
MKFLAIASVLSAAVLCSTAVAAPLSGGVTAEQMAAALKAKGLAASIVKAEDGTPKIESAIDDAMFQVWFYDCDKQNTKCTSVQFSKGYDIKPQFPCTKVNEWNRDYRFGRIWTDKEDDPFIELDLDVQNGGTTEMLVNYVDLWMVVFDTYTKFLDDFLNKTVISQNMSSTNMVTGNAARLSGRLPDKNRKEKEPRPRL